jgi:hypothetical protein
MPASTLRRIHAFLLNMALLSLPLYLVAWMIDPAFGQLIAFVILIPLCLFIPVSVSPGHLILSIQPDRTVDDEVLSGESWATLFLGFVFVQWGSSTTLYWTQLEQMLPLTQVEGVPYFGALLDPSFSAAISTSWGLLTIFVGVLFYKLSPVGLWLGAGIVILNAIDLFVSREGWINAFLSTFLARQPAAVRRRHLQCSNHRIRADALHRRGARHRLGHCHFHDDSVVRQADPDRLIPATFRRDSG